jgi:hypothetical protein
MSLPLTHDWSSPLKITRRAFAASGLAVPATVDVVVSATGDVVD